MDFAEMTSEIKSENGLTLEEFAAGLGHYLHPKDAPSRMTIFNWLHGKHLPGPSKLEVIRLRAPEDTWQARFARQGFEIIDTEWALSQSSKGV